MEENIYPMPESAGHREPDVEKIDPKIYINLVTKQWIPSSESMICDISDPDVKNAFEMELAGIKKDFADIENQNFSDSEANHKLISLYNRAERLVGKVSLYLKDLSNPVQKSANHEEADVEKIDPKIYIKLITKQWVPSSESMISDITDPDVKNAFEMELAGIKKDFADIENENFSDSEAKHKLISLYNRAEDLFGKVSLCFDKDEDES